MGKAENPSRHKIDSLCAYFEIQSLASLFGEFVPLVFRAGFKKLRDPLRGTATEKARNALLGEQKIGQKAEADLRKAQANGGGRVIDPHLRTR